MLSKNLESLDRAELLSTVRRLLAEADALSSRISAVNEIGVAMNHTLDLDTIERVIAKQAKWLLDFSHCSVCLPADGEGQWQIKTLFGPDEATTVDLETMENISRVLKTRQPQLISAGSPSPFLSAYQSQLIIPLSADNMLLGTINFANATPSSYTHDDMRIGYMLSLQLSAAIRNANIVTELKVTQDELKLRVEELDAYGHTIAHDLKSPLSNILIRSQMLKMKFVDTGDAKVVAVVDSIEHSSKLMNRMIDQLLWLAKLRHGQQTLTRIDIKQTVERALARFSSQIEQKHIQVEVKPDLPDARGHEQWVEEVFANLISNAIKYMGEDNADPRIIVSSRATPDGHQRYEIRDTGVGIKQEDQQRLFTMFTRLNNDRTEGLGLGLSIVHRMVQKLGGRLGIESEPGKGSTFWFTLPTPAEQPTPPDVLKAQDSRKES